MQVYCLFPVGSVLLFSGLPRLVCMCLCLARNACMPHAAVGSGVQVTPPCRLLPLHLNSDRILNSVKTLKLSMNPVDAFFLFLSASISLLTGGEEREGRACLLAVGGATPEAPSLLCFLPLSGFLCMVFVFFSLLQRICSCYSQPQPKKKPFPSKLSQEETHPPCRGP